MLSRELKIWENLFSKKPKTSEGEKGVDNPKEEAPNNSDNSAGENNEKNPNNKKEENPTKNSDSFQINEEGKKFLEQQVSDLWNEIVKARQILEDSKTEGGKALSPVAYKNIEESINAMIEARTKIQNKLNKKLTYSEVRVINDFSEKLAKITEEEEKFVEHHADVSAAIAKIQAEIDEKNKKLDALEKPKGILGRVGSIWNKAKSFVTRRPSKIDTLAAEKEKLENELESTQKALALVENKQKELQAKKSKLLNDFTNSL